MGAYPILAHIELFENDDIDTAISWLLSGLEEFPDEVQLHFHLRQLYFLLENLEDAKAEFSTALSLDPENPESLLAMANLSLKEGLEDEAVIVVQYVCQR